MIVDAADGRFPVADGGWRRMPPWRPGLEAAYAFTAHAVMCVHDDVDSALLEALGADGLGGAQAPSLLTMLAGPGAWTSSLDVVLFRPAGGRTSAQPASPGGESRPAPMPPLVERPDLACEPRVAYAARLRSELTVFGYADPARAAVAIVGRGLAGLRELSYELEPDRRGRGEGTTFVRAALRALGRQSLVACVAPGNVASLRILLACGFIPVGSVQLLRRRPGYVPSAHGFAGSPPREPGGSPGVTRP